jgi:ATP-dependent protease ClpP protease subunit
MDATRSLIIRDELYIYGILDDAGLFDEVRSIDVAASLAQLKTQEISVRVNSPGGSLTTGLSIYNALIADSRKVTIHIDSMAASAASVVAMAGDNILIAESASLMAHSPWSIVAGTAEEMRAMSAELDRMEEIIVDIYAKRTKIPAEDIRQMLRNETFMGAQEAVARGFADAVETQMKIAACAALSKEQLREFFMRGTKNSAEQSVLPVTAATATTKEAHLSNQTPAVETPAIVNMSPDPAPVVAAVDTDAIRAEAIKTERERVSKIQAAVRNARLEPTFAEQLIADGVSAAVANERIVVAQDDTQTRKDAMEEALSIRLGVKAEPSAAARQFMDYGIVDMAAERIGNRGRYTTFAAREAILNAAFHTTSDFPITLENALNKSLASRYAMAMPTYREFSSQMTFNDFRAHKVIRAGDFPDLQEVNEHGEIPAGTFSEAYESATVKAYGVQVGFSRQLLVNDNLDAIQQVLASRADRVAAFEDATFYAMMLVSSGAGPTLAETSRAVFNTTDDTKANTGAAIDVTTLSAARAALRKKTSLDGLKLNIVPSILLVGPAYESLALQYTSNNYVASESSKFNPWAGSLRVVVTPYITGNGWYLLADPATGSNFTWGLLNGYQAPRFRMDEPFGQQGMRVSLEHDFGCAAMDFRFGYLNAGA